MDKIKPGSQIENLQVTDTSEEGTSLAKHNALVIFITGAVPGDRVNVTIKKLKKNFAEAVIDSFVEKSPHRTEPFCSHFGTCGGCKWQHLDYEMQLVMKQKHVEDSFQRIGGISHYQASKILPSDSTTEYRNRLDFAFADKRWLTREEILSEAIINEPALGFHIPKRFDKILDVHTCYLQDDLSNQIRRRTKELAKQFGISFFDPVKQTGSLRNLVIRNTTTGEWMVIVVFKENPKEPELNLMESLAKDFPGITSLLYIINPKRNDTFFDLDIRLYSGRKYIQEKMGKLVFRISAKSFYQTNSKQAEKLYETTRYFAGLTGKETVYDLYTGTGTIANFVAGSCQQVIGIDYIEDAINDAKLNSEINGITNTNFYSGDLKAVFNEELIARHGHPDVLITDPPRAGMHEKVIQTISELLPGKIVYVSCNAATQARDIKMLSDQYALKKIQPVDMFPHTSHVENVALLLKK